MTGGAAAKSTKTAGELELLSQTPLPAAEGDKARNIGACSMRLQRLTCPTLLSTAVAEKGPERKPERKAPAEPAEVCRCRKLQTLTKLSEALHTSQAVLKVIFRSAQPDSRSDGMLVRCLLNAKSSSVAGNPSM